MQLDDPRLKFAGPLIEHWCSIRHSGELVPWEQDLRPTLLLGILPMTQIMDVSKPGEPFIAIMGKRIRSRYPEDRPRPRDWFKVLPGDAVEAAQKMIERVASAPCGVYYRYCIVDGDRNPEDGEALALPLMTPGYIAPSVWISLTNVEGSGKLMSPPVSLASLTTEYVDIGVGDGVDGFWVPEHVGTEW